MNEHRVLPPHAQPESEDVLDLPRSWARHLHPRRDGPPGPRIKVAGTGEGELCAPYADEIEKVLGHAATDPAYAAAAREHLAGTAGPLGAAVVAAVPESEYHTGDMTVRFVDAWVTTHGLPFAVHAFVERCGIEVGGYGAGESGLVPRPYTGLDGYRLLDAAKRLRALLAVAPDAEYAQVVALLAGLRTTPLRQGLAAYLVPTEREWVAECCTAPEHAIPRELLLRSLGSPEDLARLGPAAYLSVVDCFSFENLVTLAVSVGPALAPYLAVAFDAHHGEPRRRKGLLEVLGRLPSDEAFRLMLARTGNPHLRTALRETVRRFPARAIRLLAAAVAEGDATAGELLAEHLRVNGELAALVLPELPAEVRTAVAKLTAADGRVPEAPAHALPRLLADPPWARPKKAPVALQGLTAPADPTVLWVPGERDAWRRTEIFHPYPDSWHKPPESQGWGSVAQAPEPQEPGERWDRWLADFRDGRVEEEPSWIAGLFAMGPEELIRPVLRDWRPEWERPGGWWSPEQWLRVLLARFELDALPLALRFARAKPAHGAALLLPYLDGEVAAAMAGWLHRAKSVRDAAATWFARHGREALPHLVPVALGKPGRARSAAEHALHHLAAQEGDQAVLAAARPYGERAAALVESLLAEGPELSREKVPADLGVDAEVLPQLLLRGGGSALPLPAVRNLLTLLATAAPEGPDLDLAQVLDACDEASAAEFGWALFRHWQQDGSRPEHAWQFAALGRLGDDGTVRRLIPLIRAWPGENGHHHAVRGLGVLTLIGSEFALCALRDIAQTVRYKALKKQAQDRVGQIAATLGLTADQLADRLVPDCGLDPTGTLLLDYGPRRFTVGFDEALKPYVVDGTGKLRAAPPKPGARDDATLAPAAHQSFTALKKEVRPLAAPQLQRLELAMTTGRRWTPAEFRAHLADHPLIRHLARRLVWLAERDSGVRTEFRVDEDGTYEGVDGRVVALPDGADVRIAHPLDLEGTLPSWSQLFAGQGIAQPFPQLARVVHALDEAERATGRLVRFEGVTVPFGNVLRLERRGWHRGPTDSDGGISCLLRPVPGGRYVVVTLKTGLFIGDVRASGDQTLEAVWLGTDPAPQWHSHRHAQDEPHTFAELDAVTASEVLGDLAAVVA